VRREDLLDSLRQRPFQPFRMVVSSGSSLEIRHPELCVPGRRSVFVGLVTPGQAEPLWDRHAIVDLAHVTHLEPIDQATSSS
jgi:hypothetical protein